MITPIFNNIQNAIQVELFKATKSIKIAVAWFTNDLLFQILLLKLQTGVMVEIILNDDDINKKSEHHLDFDKFIGLKGKLYWVKDKNLMHQKFCIIDDNVVINGSYNWTYKAEYNDENITIASDEKTFTKGFVQIFNRLISKYPVENCIIEKYTNESRFTVPDESVHIVQSAPPPKKKGAPIRFPEYPNLIFYDEIEICERNKSFSCIAKSGDYYALLDDKTFEPTTAFVYESKDDIKNNEL